MRPSSGAWRRLATAAGLVSLAALSSLGAAVAAEQASAPQQDPVTEEPAPQVPASAPAARDDVEAVAPRPTRVTGRILLKDGVTPAPGSRLKLTSRLDGAVHEAEAGRRGSYRLAVPPGIYSLSVRRRLEIYESPSPLNVAPGTPAALDLLLVRDVEPVVTGGPGLERRGPDPRPSSPVVAGTVVDVARGPSGRRGSRWLEALGFLGGLLVVVGAAD